MNCETARALLLEAEPAALRAPQGTPLGAHLEACAECAGLAGKILASDAALHDALATLSAATMGARTTGARAVARRAWRRSAVLLPVIAAAAALVLLLRPEPSRLPVAPSARAIPRHTVVNGTDGSGVAVMQTRDPDITVIWNF